MELRGAIMGPENPRLFDISSIFTKDKIIDEAHSYFGMRKVHRRQ